jgi:sulfite reductase alpha subunit-like flavoprotein
LDSGLAAAAESFEAYKNSIYILNMKWKDVFHHFPSLYGKVTATHLVSMVPLIRMRYYSLASAPKHITLDAATLSKVVFDKGELDFEVGRLEKMQPGDEYTPEAGDLQIDLVVASHTFINHAKARDNGFCSSWLNSRKKNDIIYLNTVSMQSFRLPYDIKTPVVLVGTGAGIAPLRSFWQERARRIASESSAFRLTEHGDFVLVFGCRDDSEASELFKEEIKRCGHVFSKVEIAYSRMAPTFPKRYVQDVVSHSDYIRKVIAHPMCQIMICGSVNMATGVELAITNQIGNNAMKKFKQEGRFKLDVFGAKN